MKLKTERSSSLVLISLIIIALGLLIFQFIEIAKASPAAPNPGHAWTETECDTNLCVNTTITKVGIGKTNPTQKLDVDGSVNVSGNIRAEGNISSANTPPLCQTVTYAQTQDSSGYYYTYCPAGYYVTAVTDTNHWAEPINSSMVCCPGSFGPISSYDWEPSGVIDFENEEIIVAGPKTGGGNILRRMDTNGSVSFSTTSLSYGGDAAIDSTGAYIVPYRVDVYEGYLFDGYIQKWDNNNNKLWDKLLVTNAYGNGIVIDSGDNIITAGKKTVGGSNGDDCPWVGKFDSSGNFSWEYTDLCGSDWWPGYNDVAVDSSNNIIAGGAIQGGGGTGYSGYYQARLRKLNSSGGNVWSADPYGASQASPGSGISSLAVNSEDKILIAAVNYEPNPDSYDLKLYDSAGTLLWTKANFDSGNIYWTGNNGAAGIGKDFIVGGATTGNKAVYYVVNGDNGDIIQKFLLSDLPGNCSVQAIKYSALTKTMLIAIAVDTGGQNYLLIKFF